MNNILRDNIIKRIGSSPQNLDLIIPHFSELNVKRGDLLLRSGEQCKYVYFIVQGCLQVYVIDDNGNENTRELYVEEDWVTDIIGFQNQEPSLEFIKCVEPCKLLRIHFDRFNKIGKEVPLFSVIYDQILRESYINAMHRVNTLARMKGREKLKWLMEKKPGLMTRLPHKLLASYLGIRQETMARLLAKLKVSPEWLSQEIRKKIG